MQTLAEGSVWVNIDRDIEEMVKSCAPFSCNQHINLKEPLKPHNIPQKPDNKLGCDLSFENNLSNLLLSDYYSKFPLVWKLNNIRSDKTIAHLKSIFEEHGIPSKLDTGNDTQFTSALFQEFRETCGFKYTKPTFPPYPNQACHCLQMVTLTPSSKKGKINRNHSMISLPRTYQPHTLMTQYVYLTHTTTNGNLALSTAARILLTHILPWQMEVPLGRTTVIFGQQERRSVSSTTANELPMPLNGVPGATPSTLPSESTPTWEQTTLGFELPDSTPQMGSPAAEAPLRRSSRTVKTPDRLDLQTEHNISLFKCWFDC